jgi:hypothetical protein
MLVQIDLRVRGWLLVRMIARGVVVVVVAAAMTRKRERADREWEWERVRVRDRERERDRDRERDRERESCWRAVKEVPAAWGCCRPLSERYDSTIVAASTAPAASTPLAYTGPVYATDIPVYHWYGYTSIPPVRIYQYTTGTDITVYHWYGYTSIPLVRI